MAKQTVIKYNFLDLLIVLFLIIYMDVPFFALAKIGRLVFLILLFLIFLFKVKNKIDKEIIVIIIVTSTLIIIQGLLWEFKLLTLFSFLGIVILIPYFALRIIGIKFLKVFSDIIFVIAVYTTFFWLGQVFSHSFDNMLQNYAIKVFPLGSDLFPRSLIIYTAGGYDGWGYLPDLHMYRNAGAFHEPGAYAVFLCLAIAVNLMYTGKLLSKKNIFLMFILVTTFSTAGFFAMFLIILLFYFDVIRKVQPITSFMATIVITILFYFITITVPFLGEKVANTYVEETQRNLDSQTSGRIYSGRKALLVLSRYPITGKGIISSVREDMPLEEDTGGYGFMSLFSRIGVILSVFFTIYFVKGTKRISIYFSGSQTYWHLLLFSIAINLFSQKFIIDSVFIMIFLIGALSRYSYKPASAQNASGSGNLSVYAS
jgi:hypothetical protein